MKVPLIFNVDIKVALELKKEKNRSALVNSYLLNYYNLNEKKEEVKENEQRG